MRMKTLRLSVKQVAFLEEEVFDILEDARETRETLYDERLMQYERALHLEDRYERGRLVFDDSKGEVKVIEEIKILVVLHEKEFVRKTELGITNTRTTSELSIMRREIADLVRDLDQLAKSFRVAR